MEEIRDIKSMRERARALRASGKSIGFIPTMGALHEGHLSLARKSKSENAITIASIFVNPIQFGPREDYASYPVDFPSDFEKLRGASVDLVFVPEAKAMFPSGFQTKVDVENLSKPLCGPFRPGHFRGVATVVLKLLNIAAPDRAYFGEKDYQQLQVVKRMARDLDLSVEIVPCPIVREPDGLAMSSRNRYLSPDERAAAAVLHASLVAGKEAVARGERDPARVCRVVAEKIGEQPLASIEYVAAANPETLQPLKEIGSAVLLALAVRIGKARLIDNFLIRT